MLVHHSVPIKTINRVFWMILFLAVVGALAWSEWRSDSISGMGWFLATSLWSAVCGIGYSVADWWVINRGDGEGDDS